MQDQATLKDRWLSNPLWIAFTELALMLGGMQLVEGLANGSVLWAQDALEGDLRAFMLEAIPLGLLAIPILLCVLYMLITRRSSLRVFVAGSVGKRLRSLLLGCLIGLLANAVISLLAGLTGAVRYSFGHFSWLMLALLPFAFVQCACEEVFLRAYVPAYMEPRYRWGSVAFVSGTLFIFHHIYNLKSTGFSEVFCLNVFLMGVALYLMVRVNGCFWIACGFHTAWNFTQQYLFGLPNSGLTSELCLFVGKDPQASFFYDPAYGNEGSLCTTVVIVLLIVALLVKGRYLSEEPKVEAALCEE